jgi:hypothetical protein
MKNIVSFGCELTLGANTTRYPTNQAWPQRLADQCGTTVTNCAVYQASNQEILEQVVNYQYSNNDFVIIMWTFADRDLLRTNNYDTSAAWHAITPGYQRTNAVQLGPWSNNKQAVDWRKLHIDSDRIARSWIQFHHANSWLTSCNIACYNVFASRVFTTDNAIPGFISNQTTDFDTAITLDTGSQLASIPAHEKFANQLYIKVNGLVLAN